MPNAEDELKRCSEQIQILQGKLEQSGFTKEQISLLHDYVSTAVEMGVWAWPVGAEKGAKAERNA